MSSIIPDLPATPASTPLAETRQLSPAELEAAIDECRQHQAGDCFAVQRHEFLDIDPDLAGRDYTQPTPKQVTA